MYQVLHDMVQLVQLESKEARVGCMTLPKLLWCAWARVGSECIQPCSLTFPQERLDICAELYEPVCSRWLETWARIDFLLGFAAGEWRES